ncbi:MAG: hypothetical protein ACREJO_03190 [Phycisphaerales bacterium]
MTDSPANTPRWFNCLTLVALGAFTVAYFATRSGRASADHAAVAPPTPIVAPVGFDPIGYYQEKCEHCHGPYGMVWSAGFSHRYGELELFDRVRTMCAGAANAPLEAAPLDAVFAYIRSIGRGEVFLAYTAREGKVIRGEVTPGSTVTLVVGGKRIKAEVVEFEWTAPLEATAGPAEVIAEREGKTARIDLTTHSSTHSSPAAIAPAKR